MVPDPTGGAVIGDQRLSLGALYINVILSQVGVVAVLLGLAWVTSVPRSAFGIGDHGLTLSAQLGLGVLLGVGLYLLNAGSVFVLDRLGIGYSEDLRGSLAPQSASGWGFLLIVVLPIIAVSEELIFRAALIGAVAAGFDVSVGLLILISSIAFAIGHGIQGAGGIVVTGTLGAVLGVAFVASGSLLVVVTAHYLINALEFLIHEGLGIELSPAS